MIRQILFLPATMLLLFFLIYEPVQAQLQVAPVAIFTSNEHPTGRIVVRNSSNEPTIVELDLIFGFPDTDENGDVFFRRFDSVPDGQPSALEWIRIYPRMFELQPGERQTVRLAARVPAELAHGEYWVRPTVTSSDGRMSVSGGESRNIGAQVNMRRRTVLSLNHRHGQVRTGVDARNFNVSVKDNSVVATAQLARQGNAAYIGHYEMRVINEAGQTVVSQKRELAVYHDQFRRFVLEGADLESGRYTVELKFFTSDRSDPAIIQVDPVSVEASLTMP